MMPPPLPSQESDLDFSAFIHTSTPFYAERGPTQLSHSLPPSFPESNPVPMAQSERQEESPPPLFIGSSNGGFAVMEGSLGSEGEGLGVEEDLRQGWEKELEPARERELEPGSELPSLPAQVSGAGRSRILGEIPDSDAESELSSPVKPSSFGGERNSVVIKNGILAGQEIAAGEGQDGGDYVEQNHSIEAVTTAGFVTGDLAGEIRNENSGSAHEFEDSAVRKDSTFGLTLNRDNAQIKVIGFEEPTTGENARDIMVQEGMEISDPPATDDLPINSGGSHSLHVVAHPPKIDRGESTHRTALQKPQIVPLSALNEAIEEAAKDSILGRGSESMDLDDEPKKSIAEKSVPLYENGTEETNFAQNEKASNENEGSEKLIEDHSQTKSDSSAFTNKSIQEQASTEMEDVQPSQAFAVEDEVSLVPTENISEFIGTPVGAPFKQNEPEDVTMENSIAQEIGQPSEEAPPAVGPLEEIPVPRAPRRRSSRKSEASPVAAPKQGRRTSAKEKGQLSVEICTTARPLLEGATINFNNKLEVLEGTRSSSQGPGNSAMDKKPEEKVTCKSSSTRKKSQRGTKEASADLENVEVAVEAIISPAPDTGLALPVSRELSKSRTTRRKSQRGTQAGDESSKMLQEENEVIGNKVFTPYQEPAADESSSKKPQRKASSTSRKASGTSMKRQFEDEHDELSEITAHAITPSLPIPTVAVPEPKKSTVQRPLVPTREGSKNNHVLIAELKAMKIASIQARTASLEAEIAAKRAKVEEITKELTQPAAETVKRHIKLLHDYNDIRDVGQALVGMIADNRGVRIGELYEEFGVGLKD